MSNRSDPSVTEPALEGEGASIASRCVRALLNRHHVPSFRHVATIAQILGLSYTAVHRRMSGAVQWEVDTVAAVAAHYRESLADFFDGEKASDEVAGVLLVEGLRVGCKLTVGRGVRDPEPNSLVASKMGEQWVVMLAREVGVGPCFEVERMVVTGKSAHRLRVAILDDNPDETASLHAHFSDLGFDVETFTSVSNLVRHLKVQPFDGYVLDWVLDEGNPAELIGMIRADDPACPIAILTGRIRDNLMIEPAVAGAISAYKLLFFEKPTRLPIISAQMLQAWRTPGGAG
jgi:CheY-like chemotaxis protein